MLELTYFDLSQLISLIPKEKADIMTEEAEPTIKEMKKNFGRLGNIQRTK